MIEADAFLGPAKKRGFDFYCGVPCSFLTPFINETMTGPNLDYVAAASEGEAIAIAAGAWLAGRNTIVLCQNSGLGNAVNPLTSLNYPFQIPTLLITTLRGEPGQKDEPQHELMGQITIDLLNTMNIRNAYFPNQVADVSRALDDAIAHMNKTGQPYAFTMSKGSVAESSKKPEMISPSQTGEITDLRTHQSLPGRMETLERLLLSMLDDIGLIATTGKTGRELFTLSDREQHFYQVGSMGCAAAMGLGVALNTSKKVVVIDGDGALLMKMGTLATIGSYAPENLIHVMLDNGTYDSTGGQPTVSPGVEFADIAVACGYAHGTKCDGLAGFAESLASALELEGPSFVHMKIGPGSAKNLGRPTIPPADVAKRFKAFLASGQTDR